MSPRAPGWPRARRGRPPNPATVKAGPGAAPVRSLKRALDLLEALAANESGATLTELSQEVGLPASTAHRLLRTLERDRFAALDPERGLWFVGVQAFAVGNAFLANRDFVAGARPFMRALMEEAGESVNLAILDEGEVVFLSQVVCHEMMLMQARLGGRGPAHASGVGKALLAASDEDTVHSLVRARGLPRFTDGTLVTSGELLRDLAETRRRGYAIDNEEHAVGLRCVAATIHDEHGEPVAAVSLSGPRARIADDRLPSLGAMVAASVRAVTAAMGGREPGWRGRDPDAPPGT